MYARKWIGEGTMGTSSSSGPLPGLLSLLPDARRTDVFEARRGASWYRVPPKIELHDLIFRSTVLSAPLFLNPASCE